MEQELAAAQRRVDEAQARVDAAKSRAGRVDRDYYGRLLAERDEAEDALLSLSRL